MRALVLCLTLMLTASPALTQEALGLAAPDTVAKSGLLKHILPRFSLKTSVRVVPDLGATMVLATSPPGEPVFQGDGVTYYLRIAETKRQQRFRDWMISDVGKNTIDSFKPDGVQPFSARFEVTIESAAPVFEGDAARGADLSLQHCGRCHVIGPQNRMNGLGSTPSFAVLRSLADWDQRFQEFYVRKPHGSFTQVDGVTEPFAPDRPPPIVPVQITLDDLDAILAFVADVQAADLGAPLQTQ